MSEKKRPRDKHASGFLVRLPEEYRTALEELKAKTGQSYTFAVRKAVEAYLKTYKIDLSPPSR